MSNDGKTMLLQSVGRYGCCLGLLHLCLLHLLTLHDVDAMNHSSAFFNASLDSQLNISTVLDFRSQILFSFRTCSLGGRLIRQTGPSNSSEFYLIRLTQNGSLIISWRSASVEVADSVEVANLSLTNSEWFTIESSFALGQILLQVEQGPLVRRSVVLANSTFRSYLWNLDLTGGGPLEVGGGGFSGCIQQGPQVLLSSPSVTASVDVVWDECPLEDSLGCEGSAVMDPCWNYPCLNQGTCIYPGSGTNFSCQCPPIYSGSRCEVDLSTRGCEFNLCQNNGTCQSTNVTTAAKPYICICSPGFTGMDCATDKNECLSRPCQNGGQCIDEINSFSCICNNTGYTGAMCQTNIDECQMGLVTCQNGGTCMDTPGSYTCNCPLGFTVGSNCQNTSDDCRSNPCQNSGTCLRSSLGGYNCSCSPGFTGTNCQVNIDDCAGVVCPGNHTQCVDDIHSFTCQCLPGFYDMNGVLYNITSCEDINECLSHPCANGSTCVNGLNEYTCQCQAGFTGRQCQTDINECLSNPCQNGGSCDDLVGGYRCHCPTGFTGNNCSTNIDECQSRPCLNAATCVDLIGEFMCACAPGYSGDSCQLEINECVSSPCVNGATCDDLINHYTCSCPLGYTGTSCSVNIDDCHDSFCLNNGTCVDGVNEYTCQCSDNWMGSNCSLIYDPCAMNVCQNNGTCQSHPPSHNFTCQCAPGFTGHECQQNIDDCQNNSCQSYQACVDGINSYSCACPLGMTGSMCETDINECQSGPCLNGATCIDGKGNFTCQCIQEIVNLTAYTADPKSVFRLGYTGIQCERLIDTCSYRQPPICIHSGTCVHSNETFGFTCSCLSLVGNYYTGRFCQLTTDPCRLAGPEACYFGGTCQSVGDQYICHCAPGYTGDHCQTEINECESDPCHYNSSCKDGINHYTCQCIPGTTGVNCETNIDECTSTPCLNDGQCVDLINARSGASLNDSIDDRYECNCSNTGFRGVNCDVDIDECLSDPCQHNATCQNNRNMYGCSCYSGYTGVNCETDIDECLSSPCQHNSTCLQRSNSSHPHFSFDTAAGFDCICPAGITGVQCETDIDECASSPCNYGNCQDHVNGYACSCHPGYRGIYCEEEIDECKEYKPCTNGSTCLDRVADYECVCAPGSGGKVIGGKNCSVELIGCQSNLCQNGATCRPFLANETANIQDYSCYCSSGFSGKLCNISTSISFDSDSWLEYHVGDNAPDVLSVSLAFRTTLSDVTLMVFLSNRSVVDFRLELVGVAPARLRLSSPHLLNGFLMIDYPGQKSLNDANWHGIQLNLTSSNISLQVSECMEGINCSSTAPLGGGWSFDDGGVVYFGGNVSNLIIGTFVGCMQDIQVNGGTFLPQAEPTGGVHQTFVSHEVGVGCQRHDQCNPDPCNGRGLCSDLWTRYQCACQRPFYGTNCTERFPSATFGYNGIPSFAQYNITAELRSQLEYFLDVSFFFRTRKPSGLLFYVGSGTMDPSQPNVTYFAMQLSGGQLVARVKLTDVERSFQGTSVNLVDGQQHFVQLQRNDSLLRLVINSNSLDFALNDTHPFLASVIFIGGIPSSQRRRRRQPQVTPVVTSLLGTIEDIRVNGIGLELSLNRTDGSPLRQTLTPFELTFVREGEVTSDVCGIEQPCENNATCDNIFFNDFYCNCTEGFRGRNCSQLNFCVHHTCPPGGTCQNLDDGFECVSNATLNGVSSFLTYSTTVNLLDLRAISANVRTRKQNGIILQLLPASSSSTSICSIVLQLSNGDILLRFNTSSGDGQQLQLEHQLRATTANGSIVADGAVHSVNITFTESEGEVILSVDGSVARLNYSNAQTVSSRGCNSSSGYMEAYIGMTRLDVVGSIGDLLDSDFFKGCLSEVRINGILLPFFNKSQLLNNTAVQRFDLEESRDIQIGCYGDDVCSVSTNPCRNDGQCEDLWNAYSCHCTAGFTGLDCSDNINDCLSNECLNGATCVDGIANYTCTCSPGYTGFWCETNVDECLSNPCLHDGTCTDLINQYSCSCTPDYVGQRCQMSTAEDCHQSQCENNGTCVTLPVGADGLEMWKCSCVAGYTGLLCETMMDLCANNTCAVSSSTCQPVPQKLSYICQCNPGYTGQMCSEDIDECVTMEPCLNGGNCSNIPGNYVCFCPYQWTGLRCDAPGKSPVQSGGLTPNEIGIIVGVIGGTLLLAAVIAVIVFLCIARKKRATHGTYSPSRQEMAGSRVDMRSALKLPPEERLI